MQEGAAVIPIASPQIGEAERELVLQVLASGRLATGPTVTGFEGAFAAYVGARHAVMTSSGTAALHVALLAAGVRPGDIVITTPFSFIASANAILFAGARPVFADIDRETFNLSPAAVEEALERHPRARALLVVHLYGLPAPMMELCAIARRRGLIVVEDCAQAHGASIGPRHAGLFGDAGAFSFYATKNMTTGEGGAVVTDDDGIAARARRLINHGRDGAPYNHVELGFNYRMTELQAALGLAQLARLPETNFRRRASAHHYDGHLTQPEVRTPKVPPGFVHAYHHYTLLLERATDREAFIAHLAARGVQSAVYYPTPIPRQPVYRRRARGRFPVAEEVSRRVVSIPVHPGLSPADRDAVVAAVNEFRP